MLGDFIHKSKVYCIKSRLDPITPDEHEIKFKSLEDANFFFKYVASDSFAREELLEIAKWLRPTSCRPLKNCPKSSEQELLNMLCLMVYKDGLRGEYRLVELKPPKLSLRFEECCVDAMKEINRIVNNAELLGPVLGIAQIYQIIGSHSRMPALLSTLTTAYQAKQTNWKLLTDTMQSISEIQRERIYNVARREYFKHDQIEMNRELGKYWKGIMNAANK